MHEITGFLNLNKPFGITSHDCVAKIRKLLKLKRVGHGGTLDPAATGVLPIAIGKATRLLQFLPGEKAYRAIIRFGVATTTDDLEGEIITSQPVNNLTLDAVKLHLDKFIGNIQQVPPSYSAIQIQGKRLYELARAGEVVDIPTRSVEISKIDILNWHPGDFPELELDISCGSGTYIRSIARDLGTVLNVGGTLAGLIRTASSGFNLQDSLTLENLASNLELGNFQPIPPQVALKHLPAINLPPENARRWCQGQKITLSPLELTTITTETTGNLRVCDADDRFLGIGEIINFTTHLLLIPKMVFVT